MNHQRLALYGLTPAICTALQTAQPVLDAALRPLGRGFLDALIQVSDLAPLQRRKSLLDEAEQKQIQHWRLLFSGQVGPNYMASMARIAGLYSVLGVKPSAYIAAYTAVLDDLHSALRTHAVIGSGGIHAKEQAAVMMEAVDRAVLMDADLLSDVLALGQHQGAARTADGYIASIVRQMDGVCEQLRREATVITGLVEESDQHAPQQNSLSGVSLALEAIVERIARLANHTNQLALATAIEAARVGAAEVGRTNLSRDVLADAAPKPRFTGEIAKQIADVRHVLRGVEDVMGWHAVLNIQDQPNSRVPPLMELEPDSVNAAHSGKVIAGRFTPQNRNAGLPGNELGHRHRAQDGVVMPFRLRRRTQP